MRRFVQGSFALASFLMLGYGAFGADTGSKEALREQFEGKTIRIIHGSSPGGGYDIIARAFARVLPNHLPGKPANILVEPRPGGGPFRLNSLRTLVKAKPDGLTIGNAYAAWIVAESIGKGARNFSLSDVKPLGTPIGAHTDGIYCANPKIAQSWEDIEKLGRPIVWGGIAPGVGAHLIAPPWLHELGAPVKIVWGYGGTAEMSAAFRRGETELMSSCAGTFFRDYPDFAKKGHVAPIFYIGKPRADRDANLKKMGLERPPHIYEVAKEYIKEDWQVGGLEAGHKLNRLSRAYFVPAGVSQEMYAVWREAFRKVVDDPRFAATLHPVYRDQLSPMYADEMEEILGSVKQLKPKEVELLKILVEGRSQ